MTGLGRRGRGRTAKSELTSQNHFVNPKACLLIGKAVGQTPGSMSKRSRASSLGPAFSRFPAALPDHASAGWATTCPVGKLFVTMETEGKKILKVVPAPVSEMT